MPPLRLLLLACFASLLLSPALFAIDDWQPIDPADLKLTSEPKQPGADAVILYREEIYNDLLKFQSNYVRIKILTEKGKQRWSDVEVQYDRGSVKIGEIKARTIHADGTSIPFSGESFDKTILKGHDATGKLRNILVRAFTLPQVEVGSIIEYKYTLRWDDLYYMGSNWMVQDELYQRKAVFKYFPFNFGSTSTYLQDGRGRNLNNVSWVPFLPAGSVQPKYREDRIQGNVIEMVIEQVPAFLEEEYMPPSDQLKYSVRFFYTNGGSASQGADDFWKQEAKYWEKDVEKFIGHRDRMAAAAAQMVAATDTPEQKARKIYAEVQKLENLSYARERTGAENKSNKLPVSAEEVLNQKRGYRSDINRLFIALARGAGLSAYAMNVSTRDRWLFQRMILNGDQLNSEIAIVEISGKEIFLDPGTKFCPYGFLYWKRTGVQGMRQTSSGKIEFARTPQPDYKDNMVNRTGTMKLSESGELTGKVNVLFFGQEGIDHRLEGLRNDEQQRKKDLEDELKRSLPGGSTVILEQVTNWDDATKPLVARFDVSVPQFASSAGKRLLVPTTLFRARNTQPFAHPTRVQPVYFSYPYMDVDGLTVHLPDTVQVEQLPKMEKDTHDFAAYLTNPTSDKQILQFHRELLMGGFVFPVKDYPEIKTFYEHVNAGDEQQAILSVNANGQAKAN
jgi:hypothetical protein